MTDTCRHAMFAQIRWTYLTQDELMKVSKNEEFKLAQKQILYAMSLKLDEKSLESQGLDKNLIVLEPRKCYVKKQELVNQFAGILREN